MKMKINLWISLVLALLVVSLFSSVQPVSACDYGCTPGFWKQEKHFDFWVGYSPGDKVVAVFIGAKGYVNDEDTLLDALSYQGGPGLEGAARIMLRAAVASLLNSAYDYENGGVWGWELFPEQLVERINVVFSWTSREAMLNEAYYLDGYNNAGCPLEE
jgi:hypothetical protein